MSKWIEPAEAFRVLLRARHPEHAAVADEIMSYRWFYYWRSLEVPEDVYQAVDAVLKELQQHIREGRIRLRGELDGNLPADIDEIDCKRARDLCVFAMRSHNAGDLPIYREGHGLKTDRVYHRVHCNADDLAKLVNPAPAALPAEPEQPPNAPPTAKVARKKRTKPDRESALAVLQEL
jgi:hypothetical protein